MHRTDFFAVYSHLNWGATNWITYRPKCVFIFVYLEFTITNESGEPVLKMLYLHVVLMLNICGECQQVGGISKQWSGLVKEYFTMTMLIYQIRGGGAGQRVRGPGQLFTTGVHHHQRVWRVMLVPPCCADIKYL
ncbi:uncharacterized protein [Dysidea avara]|uniref:uncharacterized protein isoform X2 n=1 Tax=Dysidea avara TaxID=196820 RepID=UPI00331A636A